MRPRAMLLVRGCASGVEIQTESEKSEGRRRHPAQAPTVLGLEGSKVPHERAGRLGRERRPHPSTGIATPLALRLPASDTALGTKARLAFAIEAFRESIIASSAGAGAG